MMNHSMPTIPGIKDSLDGTPVCLYSRLWCLFLISVGFVYFFIAVLSMIFTKESRRLREISLLHDNVITFIMLPSLLDWLTIVMENLFTGTIEIHLTSHRKIQVGTCRLIIFLHSGFQTSSVIALIYAVHAEKYLLPNMNCIKPKTLCSIRLLALQVMVGFTIAMTTIMTDTSLMKASVGDCCLHPINPSTFAKTKDAIYDFSSICAICLLLRVSIDRFLKLVMAGRNSRAFHSI